MTRILLGSDTNPGGRKYNEDRCGSDSFATRGGLKLDVAVVCDGVGGEERGERAAQLAVDTVLGSLRSSDESDVPTLMTAAVRAANTAIFAESQRMPGSEAMACTLVLAVVKNGQTLHIANVGDSRIYLCRAGKLQQLTHDHTFANVMVWLGKLSPEAAAANPDADKVMRALGIKDALQVDQGLYLTTTDYGEANRLGRAGFPLKTGDSLLLCSDGLVKGAPSTGQRLITPAEIVHILQTQEGPAAARALMSVALGRIPIGDRVDNITAVVAQTEDRARAAGLLQHQSQQRSRQRLRLGLVALAVAVPLGGLLLLTLAGFAWFFLASQRGQNATATQLAYATAGARAQTQTVQAFTPTPTTPPPTAVPTLVAGEIAKLYNELQFLQALVDDGHLVRVPADETRFIAVNHRGHGANADVHLAGGTQLQLISVTDARTQIRLLAGSQLFVQSGPYPNGAAVEMAGLPIIAYVRGCLAAEFVEEDHLVADCFQGACSFSIDYGVTIHEITAGQSITFDLKKVQAGNPLPIAPQDKLSYWRLLQLSSAGQSDARFCQVPPPPTATPARTATSEATPTFPATPGTLEPASAVPATDTPPPSSTDTQPPPSETPTATAPTPTETPTTPSP